MSAQLSEFLQMSMSPVNRALDVPQVPIQLYAPPVNPFAPTPSAPGATSPYYNQNLSVYNAAMDPVRSMLGGAGLLSMSNSSQEVLKSAIRLPSTEMDPYMHRLQAAEELAIRRSTQVGHHMSNGFNLTASNVLGGAMGFGTMMTGMGLLPGLGLTMGAGLVGTAIDKTLFSQAKDLQVGSMALRQSLRPGNVGFDMTDSTGQVDMARSQELTNQIARLSTEDPTLTHRDFIKLTDSAAQQGMLMTTTNPSEVVQRVKEISKQVKTFARIVGETDLQEALKKMASLRNLGIADVNLNQAASNAQAFARMAGVGVDQMIQFGTKMGQMAQQQGISGGVGMQYGQMSYAQAALGRSTFTRAQLQQMGGVQGIAQGMTQGMIGASRHVTSDMMLHSMFRSTGGGQFEFNAENMQKLLSGGDLTQMFDRNVRSMNSSGQLLQQVQDFRERRGELQNALQERLGPQGMQLMMLRQAQALQGVSGGNMTLFTALQRVTGNEQSARQIARIAQSPQIATNMVQQIQMQNRRRQEAEKQRIEKEADVGYYLKGRFRQMTDIGFSRGMASFNARRQQEIRDRAAGIFGRDRFVESFAQTNQEDLRRFDRALASGNVGYAPENVGITSSTGIPSFSVAPLEYMTGHGVQSRIANQMQGFSEGMMGTLGRTTRRMVAPHFANPLEMVLGSSSLLGRAAQGAKFLGTSMLSGLGFITNTGTEGLSTQEIFERSQVSAKDTGRVTELLSKKAGVGSSALQEARARRKLLEGLDVDEDALAQSARTSIKTAFTSAQSILGDAKVDTVGIRDRILAEAKKTMSTQDYETLEERLRGDQGKEYISQAIRGSLQSVDEVKRARRLGQLGDNLLASGMDAAGLRKNLLTSLKKSSRVTGTGLFGQATERNLFSYDEAYTDLASVVTGAGAKSEKEGSFVAELSRLIASGDDLSMALPELAKKYEISEKRAQELADNAGVQLKGKKRLKSSLSGLSKGQEESLSKMGASSYLAKDVITRQVLLTNMQRRLSDMGVDTGEGKDLGKELDRLSVDDATMKKLLGEGSTAGQRKLGGLLQQLRETTTQKGRESVMSQIREQLTGGQGNETGVRVGSAPDAVAKQQLQMARELRSFAIANSRSTYKFGQFVDKVAAGMGEFQSGAKDIKEAGEKFQTAVGMPVPKRKKG